MEKAEKKYGNFIMNSQYDRWTLYPLIISQICQLLMLTASFINTMKYKISIFLFFLVLAGIFLVIHTRQVRKEKLLHIENHQLIYDQETIKALHIKEIVIANRSIKISRLHNINRGRSIRMSVKDQKYMEQLREEMTIFARKNELKIRREE
ncbi:hypothetical protein [Paenibacillus endoradicis]|uniref:hypothetical protein n=1 Tax=Paenibacillus endoradicis TaxID=2972487 RepID=UPI002159B126|nr:hypothetical protein [Paenibacillus endoradicis]MCR8656680.1 hypothetical protein [Paenibacillus endoradicis]